MKIIFLNIVEFLWQLIAWLVVPFALLFARKIDDSVVHDEPQEAVQRYKLHTFLRWMETPDELLPGGLYEPQVFSVYKKWGWFITAWVWIGTRNTGQGIMWNQGKEVSARMSELSDHEKDAAGIYQKERIFLGLKFISGWKVVHDVYKTKTNGGFWAVPRFTVRLASQD